MANLNVIIVKEEPLPDEIVIVEEMPVLEREFWEHNNGDPLSPDSVQRAIAEEIGETSSSCAKTVYEKNNEEEIGMLYIKQRQNAVECKKRSGNNFKPKKKKVCKKVQGKCSVCGLFFQRKSDQIHNGNMVVKTLTLEHFNSKTNTVCDVCSQGIRFSKNSPQNAPHDQSLTEEHFTDSVDLPFSSKDERKAKDSDYLTVLSADNQHSPKCYMCNKVFKTLGSLKIHVRQHTGETPYTCKICKKKFARSDNYKIHMRVHTRETPYICDVCKKGFSYLSNLKTHKRLHTGETPYECKICNRAFVQSSSLNSHMRIHTGERPYQCEVCLKEFTRTSNLNVHIRTHTGETPFECEICKKRFTRLDGLKIHLKSHSSETPFVCEVCEKPFNMLMKLKMHMRVHTGERPYGCDICKKQFKHLSNLKAHMRVHTGETPFSCKVCQREFKQLGHLKVHMKVHSC